MAITRRNARILPIILIAAATFVGCVSAFAMKENFIVGVPPLSVADIEKLEDGAPGPNCGKYNWYACPRGFGLPNTTSGMSD